MPGGLLLHDDAGRADPDSEHARESELGQGGLLARELGAWQTISWALVLGLPLMLTLTAVAWFQPMLTLLWAALLLGEQLTLATVAGGVAVVLCAGAAIRVRMAPARSPHDGKVRGKSSSVQEAK